MVFGSVAVVLVVVAVSVVVAATAESPTTRYEGAPSSTSTDSALSHRCMPSKEEEGIQFYLVDTTSNTTLFRLYNGEKIDNYFLKGKPVAVRVDVLAMPLGHGIRLVYNVGGLEQLERYITAKPFAFGGSSVDPSANDESPSRLLPLSWLAQFGSHTFTAILLDEHGFVRGSSSITISVVPETSLPGHSLFMHAPEREAFLQRIVQINVAAAARSSCGSIGDDGSSAIVRRGRKNPHRAMPLQRRVRLAGLPLKYVLRSRNRKLY